MHTNANESFLEKEFAELFACKILNWRHKNKAKHFVHINGLHLDALLPPVLEQELEILQEGCSIRDRTYDPDKNTHSTIRHREKEDTSVYAQTCLLYTEDCQ